MESIGSHGRGDRHIGQGNGLEGGMNGAIDDRPVAADIAGGRLLAVVEVNAAFGESDGALKRCNDIGDGRLFGCLG